MSAGTVWQRHTRQCPRDDDGQLVDHRCRGPWGYTVDAGRHPDGKRRQATKSGFATRREAQDALNDRLSLLKAGIRQRRGLTVGTYLDEWLDSKKNIRVTTRVGYEHYIRRYLKPSLDSILLEDLRAEHIDDLYTALMSTRHGSASASLVHESHRVLRSALSTAVKRRLIQWNPATQVELPQYEKKDIQVWDAEQLATFLEVARTDWYFPLYQLVAFTGLRRGEAIGLHWRDVDLKEGQIRVVWQVAEAAKQRHFSPPKTAAGRRRIPLDPATVAALELQRRRQDMDREVLMGKWPNTDLVFTDRKGEVLRPSTVTNRFQKLVELSGLPMIRFHDLRHTHASLALAAGVPLKVVSDRLGHSTVAITADTYTHVVPSVARDAAALIAGLVREPKAD